MEHINVQYFQYEPLAGHKASCSKAGTDMWEVTRRYDKVFKHFDDDEVHSTYIRLVCSECGIIHYESGPGMLSSETIGADQLGYGSPPESSLGYWLWAGPRIWHGDDRGPTAYYVTRAKIRPVSADDVAGVVGWSLGRRGAVRWNAGIGCTGTGWGVKEAAPGHFPSRRAAVKWIAEHDPAAVMAGG